MGMAKRSYSKKGRKIEPAVQTLTFISSTVDAGSTCTFTVDLSQCASLVNRRFYRQGINWAVAGFKVITPEGVLGNMTVTKLPNTWVMSNSWEKGFRTWQKMNRDALAEAESVRPKFLDFKIYADSVHHNAGYGDNLLPVDGANTAYVAGEWIASKYVIPDTTTGAGVNNFEVIAVGPSYPGGGSSGLNAVSLIEGYAASRGLPDILDPNAPDDAADVNGSTPENWMSALFNDGTNQDDQVLTDMITENNEAPYPFENDGTHTDTMYPGGANQAPTLEHHDSGIMSGTTIGGITHLKGGNFPCGLVRFNWNPTAITAGIRIEIDLIPGNHRGYLCEPNRS
jgi:hypothetical protein